MVACRREIDLWKDDKFLLIGIAMEEGAHFARKIAHNMNFLSLEPYATFVDADAEFDWMLWNKGNHSSAISQAKLSIDHHQSGEYLVEISGRFFDGN